MRVGFYHPYSGSVGGGDRYLYLILEEATRIRDAELFVLAPERPDPRAWAMVGVNVGAGSFEWRPTSDRQLAEHSADLDLLVALTTDVPPPSRARQSVAIIQFPFVARDRGLLRVRTALAESVPFTAYARSIAGYDRFICYSDFARGWIKRRLGVDAEVIAPPVDRPAWEVSSDRMPWIVSVGRFFRGGHDKRHDVLIDAFRSLGADGWELHLVGTAQDAGWIEKLRSRANGLAVQLHVDAPREDVLRLYSSASLYWHACGFGVDGERHPERLEHFGIATVEAMMYGCVPLVVPAGGQAEVVQDGINGRYWRAVPELAAATRGLIASPSERARLSAAASESALAYETRLFRAAIRDRILRTT